MKTALIIDLALNLLGVFIYFLNRYGKRTRKTRLSVGYWFRDNWQEFTSTMLLNIALMIIIHLPNTEVNVDAFFSELPFGLHLAGVPTLSFLLGLGFTALFYNFFRNKIKTRKP